MHFSRSNNGFIGRCGAVLLVMIFSSVLTGCGSSEDLDGVNGVGVSSPDSESVEGAGAANPAPKPAIHGDYERVGAVIGAPSGNMQHGLSGFEWNPVDSGIAESEADAAWLGAVGYPDSKVYSTLMGLSSSALDDLARGGNRTAAVIYAYKLAKQSPGDPRVFELLMDQAKGGNVFAIKTMGDISMVLDGYKDPVMASVYYGMLARAGDQSGYGMKLIIDQSIGVESILRARIMEDNLWRTLGGVYDGSSVGRRPGYDQAVNGVISGKKQ